MNNSLDKFKAEMEKRGLFRKIQVCANLIPPPSNAEAAGAVMMLHKDAARKAIKMYANHHEDFCELMAEAALDHLFDTILTDDLFTPDTGFSPTTEELADMERAKATAALMNGLFDGLTNLLKNI